MESIPYYRLSTYRLDYDIVGCGIVSVDWVCKGDGVIPGYGKPNTKNLRYVFHAFEMSFEPGGPSSHLEPRKLRSVSIIHRGSGRRVATYEG